MKKGKTSTLVVLAIEILAIAVLHAVKISQTEKLGNNREVSKNVLNAENQSDTKSGSLFSLAVFK